MNWRVCNTFNDFIMYDRSFTAVQQCLQFEKEVFLHWDSNDFSTLG